MTTDYKNTLNLPVTDFPMKGNLPQREPLILKFWEESGLYQKLRETGKDREKFILHDGPPYANGQIHIGHAINKTLKDIVVKTKTLSNYDAPFVPGWDCHGLPIELNVEKKVGKVGVDISIPEFIKACREYAETQVQLQKKDFIRLGVFGDWENPYLTMNFSYEANIIRSLSKIIANGHLQQGHKPVHWCTECGSALAEAEVEYKDKESSSIYVLFRFVSPELLGERLGITLSNKDEAAVAIWTTTPWTLPANQAVALNPTHEYVLFKSNSWPLIIVAKELLNDFISRTGMTHFEIKAEFLGKGIENLRLHHPFLQREVPIVLGDHVTLDAGTGAVHTAPAHGQEDYMVGQTYKLPLDNTVDAQGVFVPGTPYFAGEHVFKVNPHVLEVLKENQNLIYENKIIHSYAHCWRHKTPLIYRATPQWFISMEKNGLREQALTAISKTQWIPQWGETRITDMVQKRPDWCISRQRVWNTPIPLFIHKKTGELHPDTLKIMEKVAQNVEEKGIGVWYDLTTKDLLPSSHHEDYYKVTDTLDVWFDSGVSHECVLNKRPGLRSPADLYLEGSDQHRGWFQTSLLTSIAMYGKAPYRTVLTHGFTVDAQGRKMSKSLGNVIAPEKVINKLGADVLRLWIATTDYRSEMSVSEEILERASEAYRRIRNTARFFLSNLHDFNFEKDALSFQDMLSLDQWAVDAAATLQEEILSAYNSYQFHLVTQKIHNFCAIEMGSFYLDILKDRLYTAKTDGIPRRSAQTALHHILNALVRWIAPVLSFTAEEIWQQMRDTSVESVFLTTWYSELQTVSSQIRAKWKKLMSLRELVNQELERCRNEGLIGSGLAAEIELYADEDTKNLLDSLGNELRFVFITSQARVYPLSKLEDQSESLENEELVVAEKNKVGLKVIVKSSTYQKCQRCWHRRSEVGKNKDYELLCERCIENIAGEGEQRLFA